MHKMILALAVLSVSLVAAAPEAPKKEAASAQCCKAGNKKECKAGDKKECKAGDKKECKEAGKECKAGDKKECKDAKACAKDAKKS